MSSNTRGTAWLLLDHQGHAHSCHSCMSINERRIFPVLLASSSVNYITRTDLGMRCALGISSDLTGPDTKNSFAEKDAPFVRQVSKGKTFFEYMMDPENAEMVTLANVGVVGWLNVSNQVTYELEHPLTRSYRN